MAVRLGAWQRVETVVERWHVEEGWWRPNAIDRAYFALILEDGRTSTVFHDNIGGGWYEQRYA